MRRRGASDGEEGGDGGGVVNRPGVGLVKGGRPTRSGERWIRVFRRKEIDAAASLEELRKGKRLRACSGEGGQEPEVVRVSSINLNESSTELGLSRMRVKPQIERSALGTLRENGFAVAASRNSELSGNGDLRSCKLPPSFQVLPGKENATTIPPQVRGMKERQPALELPSQIMQSSLPPRRDGLEEESTAKLLHSESGLIDFLLKFSKKPDKRLESVDFLEVLSMKGIHIPPPRWWRPGGYGQGFSQGGTPLPEQLVPLPSHVQWTNGVNDQVYNLSQVNSNQVQRERQGAYLSTKRYLQPRRTPRMRVFPCRQVNMMILEKKFQKLKLNTSNEG